MNRVGGPINRRTGAAVENNIPKKRATMDIKKFGLPTNPLEMEAKMKVMEPLPTEFWKALEENIKHMHREAIRENDAFDKIVAERLIANYADDRYETLKNEIRLDFANSFRCWLATYHKFKQGQINVDWSEEDSRWRIIYEPGEELDENVYHSMPKTISDYFRKHVDAAGDYEKRMLMLKDKNLKSLLDYYLFYKYIVGGNTPGTSIPDEGVGFNELPDGFLQQYLSKQDRDDWRLPDFNMPDCLVEENEMRRNARVPLHNAEVVGSDSDNEDDDDEDRSTEFSPGSTTAAEPVVASDSNEGTTTVQPIAPDGAAATGETAANSPKTINKGKEEEDDDESEVAPKSVDIQEDDDISDLPGML